ncbi:hypothetical protein MSAN_00928900 [Mycena sanguinolenta]|uniref:Uncharacterized protein n=1 Tax=Mycena sanguinolenta TaxID=230812 RepID=A0A8H6YT45_9AGAR|nr:hypothetical protein MSAN_00928900 [Mycena sanguinolenta]
MDMSPQTHAPSQSSLASPAPSTSPGPQSSTPSANLASPSPTRAPPTNTTVPPLYIDNLAREFGLEDRDRMRLRGFTQVAGSVGLSLAEQFGQLYILAVILSEAAERRRQQQQDGSIGDLRAFMRDLQIRLDDSFTLTANQKANIRGITQDTIHEATRTVFTTMHVDVLSALKTKMQVLDLENVFGVPVREKKLSSALKRVCSSVRNGFRQDIRDSIDPASFIPLDKFVYTLASKYKLGGVAGELSDLYTIHAALLRRFAFDNPGLLWIDESEEEEDSESPPKKRKATSKKGGRVAAGQDFWAKVDAYFQTQIGLRGRNFKDPRWKSYIDQIIVDDNSKFLGVKPGMPVSMLGEPAAPDSSSSNSAGGISQFGSIGGSNFAFTFPNENMFGAGGVGSWGPSLNATTSGM